MEQQYNAVINQLLQKFRLAKETYGPGYDDDEYEYDCPVVHCPVSMVVDTKGIVNFNEESIDDDEVKKYPPTVRKDYRVILKQYDYESYLSKEDVDKLSIPEQWYKHCSNWKIEMMRQRDIENFMRGNINMSPDIKNNVIGFL